MTTVTGVARGDVIIAFAGRDGAVMTGGTTAQNFGVVHERRWHPDHRGVAAFTHL